MTPRGLLLAHRTLWKLAFSVSHSLKRTWRALFRLRTGAFLMCACMNLFYGLKAWRGNLPVNMDACREYSREPLRPGSCHPQRIRSEAAHDTMPI